MSCQGCIFHKELLLYVSMAYETVTYFIAARFPYALCMHFSWHPSNDTPLPFAYFFLLFNIMPNTFRAKNSLRQKSIVICASWLRVHTGCVESTRTATVSTPFLPGIFHKVFDRRKIPFNLSFLPQDTRRLWERKLTIGRTFYTELWNYRKDWSMCVYTSFM